MEMFAAFLLLNSCVAQSSPQTIQSLFQTAFVDKNDLELDIETIPPAMSPRFVTFQLKYPEQFVQKQFFSAY